MAGRAQRIGLALHLHLTHLTEATRTRLEIHTHIYIYIYTYIHILVRKNEPAEGFPIVFCFKVFLMLFSSDGFLKLFPLCGFFLFGPGGVKGDPKKQSKVGPQGTSTRPTVFRSFLYNFSKLFPHAKGGRPNMLPNLSQMCSQKASILRVFVF